MTMRPDHGAFMVKAQRMSSTSIATWLASHLGSPVEDKTGLTGTYDMALRYDQDDMRASSSGLVSDDAPSIFTALPEQLGLKLESAKVTVDVFVIDHIEPPTEN